MEENEVHELNFRKFEYEVVNNKLSLSVARLDKLWRHLFQDSSA